MEIFDVKITIYTIIPIDTKIHGWGAKIRIFTSEGVLEAEEVLGRTREEVEEKAQEKAEEFKKSFM